MSSRKGQGEMVFNVVKIIVDGAARIGRLALPKCQPVDTPNFLALASRGVVPHITPDNIDKHTQLAGAYMALEDCKTSLHATVVNFVANCAQL